MDSVDLNMFSDRYDAVVEALEQLDERQRRVVERHVWGYESFASIGETYGITKQGAHVVWKAALRALEELLREEVEDAVE